MATAVLAESKDDDLASIYAEKLENINKIKDRLSQLLNDIDNHDDELQKGFGDIQSLIDQQKKHFNVLASEFDEAQKQQEVEPDDADQSLPPEAIEENGTLIPPLNLSIQNVTKLPKLPVMELPPKRDRIVIVPFCGTEVDFEKMKDLMDAAAQPMDIKSASSTDTVLFHVDDQKEVTFFEPDIFSDDEESASDYHSVDEEEETIAKLEKEKSQILIKSDLPEEVEKLLGRKHIHIPKQKKEKRAMERDLRKINYSIRDCDEDDRRYAKLSIMKYRDMLRDTYKRYCIIGGDRNWLNLKGWVAMYHHAYIPDKDIDGCTEADCKALFREIYYAHHPLNSAAASHALASPKQVQRLQTTTLLLSDWNDADPWSGQWKEFLDTDEAANEYTLKQMGDTKLIGYIKNFEYGEIHGSINPSKQTRANIVISWHEGARAGKRRNCKVTLIKPKNSFESTTMSVEWSAIPDSIAKSPGAPEKGTYVMTKQDLLGDDEANNFKDIGLARHEFLDAMMSLATMRFPDTDDPLYALFCKLCEQFVIPYIWDGVDPESHDTKKIKAIFRPHSTELHKLFADHATQSLMDKKQWTTLVADVLKMGDFKKGGKPTTEAINGAFELSKEGYDLTLGYKGFEKALENLAHEMYRNAPKHMTKYQPRKFADKLKMLVKWCSKLQKAEKVGGGRPNTPRKSFK